MTRTHKQKLQHFAHSFAAAFFALALTAALAPVAWAAPENPTALTTQPAADAAAASSGAPSSVGLPARYDAREDGLVSPVRLQDPWGACWAFGSLAAMEANLVKQGLAEAGVQLSPRHLIYFAGTPVGSEAGAQAGEGQNPIQELVEAYGINAVFELGGHALEVASAISSGQGVVYEASYPYQNDEGYLSANEQNYDSAGTWTLGEGARYEANFTLRNMHRLPTPATFNEEGNVDSFAGLDWYAMDDIKQAILDYGSVSVSYCSYDGTKGNPNYYDAYNHTFFTNETTAIDHDVCIVGWDDSIPAELFTTGAGSTIPEGNGAWIVKNSWGSITQEFPNQNDWGWEGYFYLSYYDRSAQGFTAWEMMPLETTITNQFDYMGQRSNAETRVTDYSPQAFANVFTLAEDQKLEAVSVNTYAPETEVTIQLFQLTPEQAKGLDPTVGSLLEEQTLTCSWAGYHRIPLAGTHNMKAGDIVAVVVSMVETDSAGNRTFVASIEAGNNEERVHSLGVSHFDTVVCNVGETRVLAEIDGQLQWVDGTTFAALLHEGASDGAWYGNACIKLFANPYTPPKPTPTPQPDPAPSPDPDPAPTKVVVHKPASTLARTTAHTADINLLPLLVLILVSSSGVGAGVFGRRA